jgi:glycosyltransferase involved in cell wall biosynthesis
MPSGREPEQRLVVGVDARLRSGQPGGVEQFIIGLTSGLSRLADGEERYVFLALPGEDAWLTPYLEGPCTLAARPRQIQARQWLTGTLPRRAVEVAPWLLRARGVVRNVAGTAVRRLPSSDGTLESVGSALIHFPLQSAFLTPVPSIYQPWDLQHLHLPHFFSSDVYAARERSYREFCRRAELVVVASNWAKSDLMERYGLPAEKIAVIPVPPPLAAYGRLSEAEVSQTVARLGLPDPFLFYPAQTWMHKNHMRLLQALAIARERYGAEIPLVCSGRQNGHFRRIEKEVERLQLGRQVRFLGFVTQDEVQAIYRRSRGLIFPSLFEGWGLPVVEAFSVALPVACARVTSLPELVGDAALVFDPEDPSDIADAMWRLWIDEPLRKGLAARGLEKAGSLDWLATARTYRAHYRRIAGQPMLDDDLELVAASFR